MYISKEVVKKLNLMALREKNFGVKAFIVRKINEIERARNWFTIILSCKDIAIRASVLLNICLPVGHQ